MPPLVLSPLQVDFDQLVAEIQADLLARPSGSWNELITAATGQTIVEFLAACTHLELVALIRAAQETVLDSAVMPSSIYRICRRLGVHIMRRQPCNCTALLTRQNTVDAYSLPAFTSFNIATGNTYGKFFNRNTVAWANGQAVAEAELFEGSIETETLVSTGEDFQRFFIGPEDFSVSDVDIYMEIGGETWTGTTEGLWLQAPTATVFYQRTMPNGQVEILLGNNITGKRPDPNLPIVVRYARCSGTAAIVNADNLAVTGITGVNGYTTSTIGGGSDPKPPSYYKVMAPHIYSGRKRAITGDQYHAVSTTYPGVLDAKLIAQRDENIADIRWMNVIHASLLVADRPWSEGRWNSYERFMRSRGIYTARLVRDDPEELAIDFACDIYCFQNVDLASATTLVRTRIMDFFALGLGSIGREYRHSDIVDMIKDTEDPNLPTTTQGGKKIVDWVNMLSPERGADIVPAPLQYITLKSVIVNAAYSGRSLPITMPPLKNSDTPVVTPWNKL